MATHNFDIKVSPKFWRYLFILYSAIILIISIIPTSSAVGGYDKLKHFLAFFLFVILLRYSWKINFLVSIIITVAFGGFIELIQAFIPYRSCDILDLAADGVGGVLGSFLMLHIKGKKLSS